MFDSFLEDKGKLLYTVYGVVKNYFSIIDAVFLKGVAKSSDHQSL